MWPKIEEVQGGLGYKSLTKVHPGTGGTGGTAQERTRTGEVWGGIINWRAAARGPGPGWADDGPMLQ